MSTSFNLWSFISPFLYLCAWTTFLYINITFTLSVKLSHTVIKMFEVY